MTIPKFYCLTLPEKPHRREKAEAHFQECGVSATFVPGLYGEVSGLRTRFPYEVDAPGSGFNMGAPPVGIFLAHYMMWNALTLQEDEHAIILEDDAKFPRNWRERFEEAFKDVPEDFDMLFLGSCCTGDKTRRRIAGQVYEVKWPQCLQCYAVAKKALPTLLDTNRVIYAPIDIALTFHSMQYCKVYTVLPRIVDQFDTVTPT